MVHRAIHYADNVRHFAATHRSQIATYAAIASLAIPVVGEAVGGSALAISAVGAVADVTSVAAGSAAAVGDVRRHDWTSAALDIVGVASVGIGRGLGGYAMAEDGAATANYARPASSILKQDAAMNRTLGTTISQLGSWAAVGSFGGSVLNQQLSNG